MDAHPTSPVEQSGPHPLLEIRDLAVRFDTHAATVRAVDGISLSIFPRQIVALVGESGCGKSATALSILRLIPAPPGVIERGEILVSDDPHAPPVDLLTLTEKHMTHVRGALISMIFQDPQSSLNPVRDIVAQVAESFTLHGGLRGREARTLAVEMLERVGLDRTSGRARVYPHQLSGGMQQRVMIAMALACHPSLLIADEPTTALDVTIQREILNLLRRLRTENAMSILLITHDLGVVAQLADYVYVMYAGKIVEHADVREIFANPMHPYTQGLLRCQLRQGARSNRLPEMPESIQRPTTPPQPISARMSHYVAPPNR